MVREWIQNRKSGTLAGRMMVRTLNMVEMRYRCTIVAAWWRTYHNVHAGYITRCTNDEYHQMVESKRWTHVDVETHLRRALEDCERFGTCLLAWDLDDRAALMQLKERRLRRALPKPINMKWDEVYVVELANNDRLLYDYFDAAIAVGGNGRLAPYKGPVLPGEMVFGALPPDQHGRRLAEVVQAAIQGEADLTFVEGPRAVKWEVGQRLCDRAGIPWHLEEFVTTEMSEASARGDVFCPLGNGWERVHR